MEETSSCISVRGCILILKQPLNPDGDKQLTKGGGIYSQIRGQVLVRNQSQNLWTARKKSGEFFSAEKVETIFVFPRLQAKQLAFKINLSKWGLLSINCRTCR
jgi:hypothetical protein